MSQESRQRREARRLARDRSSQPEIISMIDMAIRYAVASPRAATSRIEELNSMSAAAQLPHLDPAALVVDQALSRIRKVWEYGWQPLDLVHAVRRQTSVKAAKWLARAVLVEADRTDATQRAPQQWIDQLDVLSSRHDHAGGADALLPAKGRAPVDLWVTALVVLDFMHKIPPSEILMPTPSQWGQQTNHRQASRTQHTSSGRGGEHAKVLNRIRALLAKAESTEFSAEAEAFTAKAQDLMTRHAIDEALIADQAGLSFDVQGLRVLVEQPYAVEKARLLAVIARANRIQAVWNDFASCATLVGVKVDLEQVEMLFTSLLVQATRAMTQAGQNSHGADRSTGFRKSFLTAYASRIGERLAESTREAQQGYGSELVPVFQRQADAVAHEFDRLFPHVTQGSSRSSFDARGWHAGTAAANAAVLSAGAVES